MIKMKLLGNYKNGNESVSIYEDGTKIRQTNDDQFKPAFAESCDFKITNQCDMNCPYCHEASTSSGTHADLKSFKFLDNLPPYTEMALGGGNILQHPDIDWLLKKLYDQKVIANITLNQHHFMTSFDRVKAWYDNHLVRGVGVSLQQHSSSQDTGQLIQKMKSISTSVLHVINGVFTAQQYKDTMDNNIALLILGYKDLRRGHAFLQQDDVEIKQNQQYLFDNLMIMANHYRVIALDNLALKQLPVKQNLSKKQWDATYQGEDGSATFYIDGPNKQFAISSTTAMDQRYALKDDIKEMFQYLQK